MPKDKRPIDELYAEIASQRAVNFPAMFRERVQKTSNKVAYKFPGHDGESIEEMTWQQTQEVVDTVAAGLIELGLKPEQRVVINSSTRMEWVLADLGIACAGGATTTVYPNTTAEDTNHIVEDSGSVIAFVENTKQLAKLAESEELHKQIHHVILFDDDRKGRFESDKVLSFAALKRIGRERLAKDANIVDDVIAAVKPEDLSTLIYTSGTTGKPKGVELLNSCWTQEGISLRAMQLAGEDDLLYLWLPLAHVFGRDLETLQIALGVSAYVDGRVDKIVDNLAKVKPTILVGVPRIFEKVRAGVMTKYPKQGIRGRLARWAFAVGRDSRSYRLEDEPMPPALRAKYAIADKLVFSKLKELMGGNMKFMISGSAKLSSQVQEWFYSAGITLIEGYGSTETAAVAFLNPPYKPVFGSVGRIVPGCETKLDEEGEIMIRGDIIARGYHGLTELTAEAFTEDGWYRTGDIGRFDEDGNVFITDRKKDLFKTSNGKYVSPQKVENALMANVPYLSSAVAVGEGQKYVTALVTMDPQSLNKWAAHRGKEGLSYAELTQLPEIRESIDRFVRRTNKRLEPWEQITRYEILDREFTMEGEELTASQKVRRRKVLENNAELIEKMYERQDHSDLTSK